MTFTTFAKFYVVFKWLIFVFITALKDCLTCFCPSLLLLSLEGNEQEWGLGMGWGLMAGGWGDQTKTCPSFTGIPGTQREREREHWLSTTGFWPNWTISSFHCVSSGLLQIFFFFLPFLAALNTCGILVSHPGMEQGPLQWKHGVLTTGLPGNSPTGLIGLLTNLSDLISRKIFLQCKFEEMRKSLPGAPSGPAALSPTTLLLYPSAWNALFLLSGFHRSAWSVYPPHPASRPLLSTLRTQSRHQLFLEMFSSLLVRPGTQNTVLMASLAHVYQGAWACLPWLMSTRDGLACPSSGWYTPWQGFLTSDHPSWTPHKPGAHQEGLMCTTLPVSC